MMPTDDEIFHTVWTASRIAAHDQKHAEAMEALRDAKQFLLFVSDSDIDSDELKVEGFISAGLTFTRAAAGMAERQTWRLLMQEITDGMEEL